MTQLGELKTRLAELADLDNIGHLLEWDQSTMMPPSGAQSRSEALATLGRISHELLIADRTARLLDGAAAELNGVAPDSDDARVVAVARRRFDKARRVPAELVAEMARAGALGYEAWVDARRRSDFAAFVPYLEHNLELAHRYVECFEDFDSAYDVLLDNFEPGMKTAQVAALFADLRAQLQPLIEGVRARGDQVDDSCLYGTFPTEAQRRLVAEVLSLMGFDSDSWRMDDTVHPFASNFGVGDTRITTRWDEGFFPSALYGAMHECGHGLYEAGIAKELKRTPLGHGESLSLHESQSRLWENMVGRSRAFSGVLAPRISELFDSGIDPESLYRAVNRVQPSLIRVEADEATYGLHIVLRFEFEQELIDGRLAVAELPEAWNARMKDYLGVDVPDDARGVLQDVHWSAGMFGYFPTYALGNLVAGQLWERAHDEVEDLDGRLAAGELGPLREWLRENVHRHGAKFEAGELLQRVTGSQISVGPFVAYLESKLSDIYSI
jgi:carboxypeptidase Taq